MEPVLGNVAINVGLSIRPTYAIVLAMLSCTYSFTDVPAKKLPHSKIWVEQLTRDCRIVTLILIILIHKWGVIFYLSLNS